MVLNNTCKCMQILRRNIYGLVYIHTHIRICMYTYTRIHAYTYICIHIHTHTYIHTYMDTYTYTYAHTCTYTYIHIHVPMHTYIYMYIYIYRTCTSCREHEANVYADVHNICLTYTPAHVWCATTLVNTCRLCAKNSYGLVYARLFNCAAASLPWKLLRTYLESCANIVQAVVYCPPSRPPSCSGLNTWLICAHILVSPGVRHMPFAALLVC